MDIGKKIRSRREELRLSCEEAAKMAGINPSTLDLIRVRSKRGRQYFMARKYACDVKNLT